MSNKAMEEQIRITFTQSTIESLQAYSELLNKDINTILHEALEQYFETQQQKLMQKNRQDDSAMTNLDFDEFWGDVDLDS
ncbi:MAG TPA: hypothetical protein PLH07_01385 [Sulfurovum sp.]|nr:hypothetical protein [Sulfurovum sp.]HQS72013.1 hypothetical protein [Sulfurovum sp.]HQT27931.1 hypothetical protein [Sulfurovum sp.]